MERIECISVGRGALGCMNCLNLKMCIATGNHWEEE